MANGNENANQERTGPRPTSEQIALLLKSMFGQLSEEDVAGIQGQEQAGTLSKLAANIDPQADAIGNFIAKLFGKAGRGAKAVGTGVVETAKAVPKGLGFIGRGAFNPETGGGRRRSALNIIAPGTFGASSPASPEIQALLQAAEQIDSDAQLR